eukprot:scaffold710_cov171-Amphora_coffeaeformis.AAC.37
MAEKMLTKPFHIVVVSSWRGVCHGTGLSVAPVGSKFSSEKRSRPPLVFGSCTGCTGMSPFSYHRHRP